MKILIAPLNWGLGHATRCVALVRQYVAKGDEVVLGGDGESLVWLKRYFPDVRTVELASLELHYSKSKRQVVAMLKSLPKLIRFTLEDEARLNQLLVFEPFDLVVSDNRFGLHSTRTRCVYITHQLWIRLPRFWQWLEPLTAAIHKRIYRRFNEVWVPDYADTEHNLSGLLGHPQNPDYHVKYIGPLSRFTMQNAECTMSVYKTVVVLSGLEPQRTILEKELIDRLRQEGKPALLVRGKINEPFTRISIGEVTIVPYLNDAEMMSAMQSADKIICRSGYSSIMDMEQLGLLEKVEWIPTPGQPEQEYLAKIHKNSPK